MMNLQKSSRGATSLDITAAEGEVVELSVIIENESGFHRYLGKPSGGAFTTGASNGDVTVIVGTAVLLTDGSGSVDYSRPSENFTPLTSEKRGALS